MSKEFNEKARLKLVDLYTRYVEEPSDKLLEDSAMKIHQEYASAYSLLDEDLVEAVTQSTKLAFGELSVKEAKALLSKLEKK